MEPETIEVTLPPGTIGPGPSDPRMYVADAVAKAEPYDPPSYMPPYRGPEFAPAVADRRGHFDEIAPDTRQFMAAHLYGSARRTLDVWERYLQQPIVWWHERAYPRLELIPLVDWPNAQSGAGFLETGLWPTGEGEAQPFALNFDVIAHETGHAMLFSVVGAPPPDRLGVPYLAFHESFADLTALVAVLHFPGAVDRLLEETNGNLYVLNLLNRFAEISAHQQLRLASNRARMQDVAGITLAPDGTWIDPQGLDRNQHAIAEPLTGAIFDVLVELFQDGLVADGLIPPDMDTRGWTREEVEQSFASVHQMSGSARRRFAQGFHASLRQARDIVGLALANVLHSIGPEQLSFDEIAARFIEGVLARSGAELLAPLIEYFRWRGIGPGPFLRVDAGPVPRSRSRRPERAPLTRSEARPACCQCGNSASFIHARRHMLHAHRALAR
jgi:hypothetical protein